MITEKSSITIHTEGVQSESFFNVKQENLAHIFGILRNQLYSDKISAIIREYCTNAMDAHIDAGFPNQPIQVTLPNAFAPQFSVRDFGKGLSEEDVFAIFGSYGESTKRNTNDMTGCLGLGSKSAFAYASNFTFISFHKGIKSVYSAFIDESEIGKISKLHSEPSDEPSGIQVVIQAKQYDYAQFITKAYEICRHFDPTPNFVNSQSVYLDIENYKSSAMLTGENWSFHNSGDRSGVSVRLVMGNVAYPVVLDNLDLDRDTETYVNSFFRKTIILKAPIGSVKNSASRESLEYNALTKDWISNALNQFKNELIETLSKQMDKAETYWDALKMFNDLKNKVGSSTFMWRGERIQQANLSIHDICKQFDVKHPIKVQRVVKTRNDTLRWDNQIRVIQPTDGVRIFVYNGDVSKMEVNARIAQLGALNVDTYLMQFSNPDVADKFMNTKYTKGMPFIDVKSINYVKPPRKSKASAPSVYSDAYTFVEKQYFYHSNPDASFWQPEQMDMTNGQGVYVEIKRYKPQGYLLNNQILNDLAKGLGIKIYGVRPATAEKLGSGWKHISEYAVEHFNDLNTDNDLITLFDKLNCRHNVIWDNFAICNKHYPSIALPYEISDIVNYINKALEKRDSLVNFYLEKQIFEYFVTNKPKSEIMRLEAICFEKYPLLKYISELNTDNFEDIVAYTRLVE